MQTDMRQPVNMLSLVIGTVNTKAEDSDNNAGNWKQNDKFHKNKSAHEADICAFLASKLQFHIGFHFTRSNVNLFVQKETPKVIELQRKWTK